MAARQREDAEMEHLREVNADLLHALSKATALLELIRPGAPTTEIARTAIAKAKGDTPVGG